MCLCISFFLSLYSVKISFSKRKDKDWQQNLSIKFFCATWDKKWSMTNWSLACESISTKGITEHLTVPFHFLLDVCEYLYHYSEQTPVLLQSHLCCTETVEIQACKGKKYRHSSPVASLLDARVLDAKVYLFHNN